MNVDQQKFEEKVDCHWIEKYVEMAEIQVEKEVQEGRVSTPLQSDQEESPFKHCLSGCINDKK